MSTSAESELLLRPSVVFETKELISIILDHHAGVKDSQEHNWMQPIDQSLVQTKHLHKKTQRERLKNKAAVDENALLMQYKTKQVCVGFAKALANVGCIGSFKLQRTESQDFDTFLCYSDRIVQLCKYKQKVNIPLMQEVVFSINDDEEWKQKVTSALEKIIDNAKSFHNNEGYSVIEINTLEVYRHLCLLDTSDEVDASSPKTRFVYEMVNNWYRELPFAHLCNRVQGACQLSFELSLQYKVIAVHFNNNTLSRPVEAKEDDVKMQDVSELDSRTTFARSKSTLVGFVKDRLIALETAKHIEYYFSLCSFAFDCEYDLNQSRQHELREVINCIGWCGHDATVITQLSNLIKQKRTINQVMSAYLAEYMTDTLTILNAF